MLGERRAGGIGRRQALDPEPVEQRARREGRRRKLLLDPRVDRLRAAGSSRSSIPNTVASVSRSQRPVGVQREQVDVVGEQLPDGAVVDLGPAEPAPLERHALRVEHSHDVVIGRDEEPAGRVEPCGGVGEELLTSTCPCGLTIGSSATPR